MCPWDLDECGNARLGQHGNEWDGVPIAWSNRAHPAYHGENRKTMSCGLCGHLRRELGVPPLILKVPRIEKVWQ